MAEVLYQGVTKRFGETVAVDHLELAVLDGEFLVLLGPSGCGKTTALRMVAGLEEPDEGTITIGPRVVNYVEPKDRDVAMVFQSYALYPHLTVARNLEFPLRQRHVSREERSRQVVEVAELLGLQPLLGRKPAQLSGGQRQRVALGRAIVRNPQVFLMDEPLSNLDAALRVQTRAEIVNLQHRLGVTTLYVTHDQVEAMTMGNRIAVMSEGVLQQVGAPQDLYMRPGNTFVARFLGSPGMNLMEGQLAEAESGLVTVSGGAVAVGRIDPTERPAGGRAVIVGARPEDLRIVAEGQIKAEVIIVELLGAESHVICRLADNTQVVVRQPAGQVVPRAGETISLSVDPRQAHLFDAGTTRRVPTAP